MAISMTATRSGAPPQEDLLAACERWRGGGATGSAVEDDRAAGDLLARLASTFADRGVTRFADLTALDVIGVPVFAACRPNSRSLSVCQGKGVSAAAARLGAGMEALEQAFAERFEELVVAEGKPADVMHHGARAMPLEAWPGATPNGNYRWVSGYSLLQACPVLAPFDLVGLDLRADAAWDRRRFAMNSVGLGAATTLEAATHHGLLELIENDAVVALEVFGPSRAIGQPTAYEPGVHAGLDWVAGRLAAAGQAVELVRLASRSGLPVVGAFLHSPDLAPGFQIFAGFACRHSTGAAACAALLEAVQSRLTHISGARDDLAARDYQARRRPFRWAGKRIDLGACAAQESRTDGAALGAAVGAAQRAGARDICVFPLGGVGDVLRVVRVVAPGLGQTAHGAVTVLSMHHLDLPERAA